MEYYPALKRKEILAQAIKCMNLEAILLSEVSQAQKGNIVLFHLYELHRIGKFIETGI